MKKLYNSPKVHIEKLELGVFGNYGNDKDDDPIYGVKKYWFGLE